MKTSQLFGVHFTIKKDKVIFALKKRVNVDYWDKGHGGLKVKAPEAKESNTYLE